MDTQIEVQSVESLSNWEKAEYHRMRASIDYGEVLGYQFTSAGE